MEKRYEWQSDNGLWKVTARVDDTCVMTGKTTWFTDTTVSKLNKRSGYYEAQPSGKNYSKEVEAARTEARNFIRYEHKQFVAKHYDPYNALSLNDAIEVHTNRGCTGKVFFQEKSDDTITVLDYVYDHLQTIDKSDIEEMALFYTLNNERKTIQLI